MLVKVLIKESCWPVLKIMWVKGQVKDVDEKQAEDMVAMGLAEIIETHERPSIPDIQLSKR